MKWLCRKCKNEKDENKERKPVAFLSTAVPSLTIGIHDLGEFRWRILSLKKKAVPGVRLLLNFAWEDGMWFLRIPIK